VDHKLYTIYTVDRLRKRRLFGRVLLWSFVGLVAAALVVLGASYLWISCQAEEAQIDDSSVSSALAATPSSVIGTPTGTDILVLGTDRWANNQGEYVRSDSLMLVHVDPNEDYLSILSLPRDLRVEVPGSGMQKLNFAYSKGGADLAIQTVKELTGVNVTEYLEVDFEAFRQMTEELGGVYVDVDCRYLQTDIDYEPIDLQPGYQVLEGENALDYVRFRLDTNLDFGRMYRQQRFMAALREQALGWDLGLKMPGLISAFFDNVQTTLTMDEITELAYWAVTGLTGDRIRQVTLDNCTNQTIDGVWYVIPAEGALEEAVEDFMTAPEAVSAAQTTVANAGTTTEATAEGTGTTTEGAGTTTDGAGTTTEGAGTTTEGAGTTEVSSEFITDPEEIADSETWFQVANQAPFQVVAPGYIPEGYDLVDWYPADGSGAYDIVVGDEVEKALKFVYQLTREGEQLDQYLGIMETTWLEAPAACAGREVEYNGVVYTVVGTAQSIDHVWWVRDGVLYWVSNTLSYVLHSSELIKVAESMIAIPSGAAD
jgi:LCP family protein required for cell wall assembly